MAITITPDNHVFKDGRPYLLPRDANHSPFSILAGLDPSEQLRLAQVTPDGKLKVDASVTIEHIDIGDVSIMADDAFGVGKLLKGISNPVTNEWSLLTLDPRFTFTPDWALNVKIVGTVQTTGILEFGQVTSVASGTPTVVVSYTVPVGKSFRLSKVEASGNNIGTYWVTIGSSTVSRKRTNWPDFNCNMSFDSIPVSEGGVIRLYCEHFRPSLGDFDGNIQGQLT